MRARFVWTDSGPARALFRRTAPRRTSPRVLVAAAVAALGLSTGCRDEQLARFEAIRDEICGCKTPSCGEEAMKKVEQLQVEASPQSRRLAREMMDCLADLYAAPTETGPDVAVPGTGTEPAPGAPTAPPPGAP